MVKKVILSKWPDRSRDKYFCYSCCTGFSSLSSGEIEGIIPQYCPFCYGTNWESRTQIGENPR